jgi:CubicO group peptidase (beta-lactamase class C family)
MSAKTFFICRKFSLTAIFMLLLQFAQAQSNFAKVDDWLDDNIKELGGRAVMMIYKDGKMVYENAVNEMSFKQKFIAKKLAKKLGKDKKEATKDFDANTVERIASCSKWLTASLVMTFVDEGKLNVEDTIGKFLPVMTANGKGGIKVKDCLSHMTGIKQENGKGSFGEMGSYTSMDECMEASAKKEMEGTPGKVFHYGNIGLQICAAICEKISGKTFAALFAERITKPLDMPNTNFGNGPVPLAAGGAFSTCTEYMHFLTMILGKGMFNSKRILSEKSIIAMQQECSKQAQVIYTPEEAGNFNYGFGEWILEPGMPNQYAQVVSSPGLFGSYPWVDNKKQYCAMLFVFNIKAKGRHEKYNAMRAIVDEAVK